MKISVREFITIGTMKIIRYKFLLLMLSLILVDSAMAKEPKWVQLYEDSIVKVFVDVNNITQQDNSIRVWSLWDSFNSNVTGGYSYKTVFEIKCRDSSYDSLSTHWYEDHMGNGNLIVADGRGQTKIIVPGSVMDELKEYVCIQKIK